MSVTATQPPLDIPPRRGNAPPIPLNEQESQHRTRAKRAAGAPKKSVVVATVLSVVCTLIVIACFALWWKRHRRKPSRKKRSSVQTSAHSTTTRAHQSRGEEKLERETLPLTSSDVEASPARPEQDAGLRNSRPENRNIYGQSGSNRGIAKADNERPRLYGERSSSRYPSSVHNGPMDIDVVTPAPSSARFQGVSTVGSVIDKYADTRSRLHSAIGQRYRFSAVDDLVRSRSRQDDSHPQLPSPPQQHTAGGHRQYPPHQRGVQQYRSEHEIGGPSANAAASMSGGPLMPGTGEPADILDNLGHLAGQHFGTPDTMREARESGVHLERTEEIRAGKQPVRGNQLESHGAADDAYVPDDYPYTAARDDMRPLSDAPETVFAGGMDHGVDLRPDPLQIHKSSSAQLLGPNKNNQPLPRGRGGRDVQGESSGTNLRPRHSTPVPAAAAAAASAHTRAQTRPSVGDDIEMHNRGAPAALPSSVYESDEEGATVPLPPLGQQWQTTATAAAVQPSSSQDNPEGLPAPLTLASVRRALGSPDVQGDPLEEYQRHIHGADEAAIQRWRDQVASDTDTRRRLQNNETLRPGMPGTVETAVRMPHAERSIAEDTAPPAGHSLQNRAGNMTTEQQRNEARSQDAARENAPSANSTWTTATPFSWTRRFF